MIFLRKVNSQRAKDIGTMIRLNYDKSWSATTDVKIGGKHITDSIISVTYNYTICIGIN